uniref:UBZ1-type domain-containing protein n=1 Tax=Petromyzon marinus TaxID=7757 RepID=S4RP86_PETMA
MEEVQRQYKELSKAKSDLETEVTGMNEKMKQLSEELDGRRKEDCALQSRYTELEQSKQALDSGLVQHKRQLEESAVRVQQLEGDLETLAKKMLDKEMELDGCKDSIKKLTAEKQQLETELKNEREEKNIFMTHIKETDLENKQLITNLQAAQAEVGKKNNAISELTEEISRLQQSAAHRERSLCGAAGAESSKPEKELGVVRELLRRTEDQLANSEQKLKLLQWELLDATSTRDKMMASLYQERTSSEELRKGQVSAHFDCKEPGTHDIDNGLYKIIDSGKMENKNVEGLREDSPDYDELRKENEDLKLRLQMGADHYKDKFKECMRLQKELTKAKQQWLKHFSALDPAALHASLSPLPFLLSAASEMKEKLGGELSSRAMEKLAEKTDKCKKYKEMFKKEKENRERLEEELQKLQRSIEEEKRATEVLSDKLAREQANMQDQISTKALELKDVRSALEKIKKEKEDLLTKFTGDFNTQHEKEDKQLLEEKLRVGFPVPPKKDFWNTNLVIHQMKKLAFLEEKCDTGQGDASGVLSSSSLSPLPPQCVNPPIYPPGLFYVQHFNDLCRGGGVVENEECHNTQNKWSTQRPEPNEVFKYVGQTPQCCRIIPPLEKMRKRCPICEMNFPPDYDQRDFEEHVQSHWKECPLCKNQYPPDMDQQKFEEHVQSHLDDRRVHPDDTIF